MKARISTFHIGSPRKKTQGLRIGTVRFLPRGVRKSDYAKRDLFDVWLPLVAPSKELIKTYFEDKITRAQFFRAYHKEMNEPTARHTIELLAAISKHTPLAVGCYCEDESSCHRSELIELIRRAVQ